MIIFFVFDETFNRQYFSLRNISLTNISPKAGRKTCKCKITVYITSNRGSLAAVQKPVSFFVRYLRVINESKFLRVDQVKFVEDSLKNILLGPFLNTLSQIRMEVFLNIYLLFTRSKPRSL